MAFRLSAFSIIARRTYASAAVSGKMAKAAVDKAEQVAGDAVADLGKKANKIAKNITGSSDVGMSRSGQPKMRNYAADHIRKHVIIALVFAFAGAAAYRQYVAVPRKKAYEAYYKTYDPELDYRRQVAAGVQEEY